MAITASFEPAAGRRKGAGDDDPEVVQLRTEALLANPLLSFEKLLVVKGTLGFPSNWDGYHGMGSELVVLSAVRPDGQITPIYHPEGRRLITDIDLNWDADKILFSMPGTFDKWQVLEIGVDGKGLRQVTPGDLGFNRRAEFVRTARDASRPGAHQHM